MLDESNDPRNFDHLKNGYVASKGAGRGFVPSRMRSRAQAFGNIVLSALTSINHPKRGTGRERRSSSRSSITSVAILISSILIISFLAPLFPAVAHDVANMSNGEIYIQDGSRGSKSSSGTSRLSSINDLNIQRTMHFFIENKGQFDSDVRFVARTEFGEVVFFDSMVRYSLWGNGQGNSKEVITLTFPGSETICPQGRTLLPQCTNYLIGSPAAWVTGAKNFGSIVYQGLWPGIDLVYKFNDGGLKYEFIIEPFVSEQIISVKVKEANITSDGMSLRFETGRGGLVDYGLLAIQGSSCLSLMASYVSNNDIFTYSIEGRDQSQELIIDPLLHSAYFGGNGDDYVQDIATDSVGNLYVIGYTSSTDLVVTNPYQGFHGGGIYDAFVLELGASDGAPIYMTYIGGNGEDYGKGIIVDSNGNVFIGGYTDSNDFPASRPQGAGTGGSNDVFVCELVSNGTSMRFSTLIGGSEDDQGTDVAIDPSGNVFLTGLTNGDFPLANPIQGTYGGGEYDAFAVKLNPTGDALIYSTYIGGRERDEGLGISLCICNNPYIVGRTDSNDFPTTTGSLQPNNAGGTDAFILWFNGAGTGFTYSTYVGGQGNESANAIAVDGDDFAYVTGWTSSTDFPIVEPFQASYGGGPTDAFEFKLNPAGTALFHSTFIGGGGEDNGRGISLDANRNAFVTGDTSSIDFPLRNPYQNVIGGGRDAFAVQLDLWSGLANSTYIGGSLDDIGQAIAVDGHGNTYLAGTTGSLDFPTSIYQGGKKGGIDSFIASFGANLAPSPPGAPRNLSVVPGNENVTLSWEPPLYSNTSAVIEYMITYWTAPGSMSYNLTSGTAYLLESLTKGAAYHFQVAARNDAGLGPNCTSILGVPFGAPDAPRELTAVAGDYNVTLGWIAPAYTGPGMLIYHLYRDDTLIWQGSKTSYLDMYVTNGHEYTYRIALSNSVGWGPDSIPVSVTPTAQSVPPGIIADLSAKAGDGQITLAWKAPTETGSSAITCYNIYRGTAPGNESLLVTVWNAVTYTDANLTNGHTYYYKVTAISSAGEGQVIEEVTATPNSTSQGIDTTILIAAAVIAAGIIAGIYLIRKRQ
jgi:hypothetical protein